MWRGTVVFNGRVFMWVLAMALLALGSASLAAPVFAQVSVVNQNADQVGLVNDSICSQVYNTAAQQYNAGDQTANAGSNAVADAVAGQYGEANAEAIAEADATNIANVTGIDIGTVNACLNGATPPKGETPTCETPTGETPTGETPTGESPTEVDRDTLTPEEEKALKADVILPDGLDQKVLADTGGLPLGGLALIGLGLMAAGVSLFRFAGRD